MKRFSRTIRTSVAALAAGLFLASGAVVAQDGHEGKDGEDGAPGADAPPAAEPSMDTAVEQCDPKRLAFVKLPKEWKSHRDEEPDPTTLASFLGLYTTKDQGRVNIAIAPGAMRASMARAAMLAQNGGGIAELSRSGPGWAECGWHQASGNPPIAVYARFAEKDGTVFALYVLGHLNSKDRMKDVALKMLASFRVAAAPAAAAPPKGFTVKKSGDFDLSSDATKDHDATVQKILQPCAETREALARAFKGKPFDESRPVLRVYENSARYNEDGRVPFGAAPDYPRYDPASRQVWARFYQHDRPEYGPAIRTAVAQQFLRQYFGGAPPAWIEAGMTTFAVSGAGKPGKFTDEAVKNAREKSPLKRNFGEWLSYGAASVTEDEQWELFAWHVFFRHGGGKKYAKQYDASLDALRQTGEPQGAADAWKGADFAAMQEEFKSWLGKWKP